MNGTYQSPDYRNDRRISVLQCLKPAFMIEYYTGQEPDKCHNILQVKNFMKERGVNKGVEIEAG